MPRRLPIFAAIAALAGGVSTAQANVTIDFAATFSAGSDASGNTITSLDGFNTGDSISGTVTYDPAALAIATGSTFAEYPLVGETLVDGGTTTTFGTAGGSILVLNNHSTYYQIDITAYTPDNSETLVIALRASDPAAFFADGLTLPSSIPLSSFGAGGYITDVPSGSTIGLDFTAADSGSAVPEPASIAMLGAGLFACALLRRRRSSDLA